MVPDKFTTNLPIKIKRQKKKERARERALFHLSLTLLFSHSRAKKIRPVNPRTVKWCSAARRSAAECVRRTIDDHSKAAVWKVFPPTAPVNTATVFLQLFKHPPPRSLPLARYVPAPLFSFHARSLPHALAYITNEHRAVPRNLYGRYSRRFHYFQLRCPVVRILWTRWITCSTRRKTGTVIKRCPSCRSNCRRDSSRNERPAIGRDRFEIDYVSLFYTCVCVRVYAYIKNWSPCDMSRAIPICEQRDIISRVTPHCRQSLLNGRRDHQIMNLSKCTSSVL